MAEKETSEMTQIVLSKGYYIAVTPMQDNAQSTLLTQIYEKDLPLQQEAKEQLHQMRAQLAGDSASPLEQILIERIAICWLQMHQYEMLYARKMDRCPPSDEEIHLKRLAMAHKRFLSAIKTLAQVRRLQLPSLQLSISA
jgi:hypothetical protein